jgi:hypothetical protein
MIRNWPEPAKDAVFLAIMAIVGFALLVIQELLEPSPWRLLVALLGGLGVALLVTPRLGHRLLLPKEERRLDTAWAVRSIIGCVWLLVGARIVTHVAVVSDYAMLGLLGFGGLLVVVAHALVRRYGPQSSTQPASSGLAHRVAPAALVLLVLLGLLGWQAANAAASNVTFGPVNCSGGMPELMCASYAPRMPIIDAWWSAVIALSGLTAVGLWAVGAVHGFMALLAGLMVVLAFWSEAAWQQMPAATSAGWEQAPAMALGQAGGSVLLLVAFFVGSAYRRITKGRQAADHSLQGSVA